MGTRVQQYIDSVSQLHTCGENSLVSVILFGSAVSGALSESSDVDLILVLPNETVPEDRRRLREAVSGLEIMHGLRLPASRRKNLVELFLERAGERSTRVFFAPGTT